MDPSCHSFRKIKEKNGMVLYYAQPSISKLYDDIDGYINHIDNMLASHGNKKWSCIFNGDGFDVKHFVQFTVGQRIVHLIVQKYGKNLQEIKFINPSWHITAMLKLISALVNSNQFLKLKVLDDRVYSILEFI